VTAKLIKDLGTATLRAKAFTINEMVKNFVAENG
jgi:hypothetical protein